MIPNLEIRHFDLDPAGRAIILAESIAVSYYLYFGTDFGRPTPQIVWLHSVGIPYTYADKQKNNGNRSAFAENNSVLSIHIFFRIFSRALSSGWPLMLAHGISDGKNLKIFLGER